MQNVVLNRERIAAWALKNRVPAVSGWAQFAEGGNLMSYGPNLREASRRLAFYVDRILKGAKPADLPVELPTQVELVVNLKAARTLGLTVPTHGAAARAARDRMKVQVTTCSRGRAAACGRSRRARARAGAPSRD